MPRPTFKPQHLPKGKLRTYPMFYGLVPSVSLVSATTDPVAVTLPALSAVDVPIQFLAGLHFMMFYLKFQVAEQKNPANTGTITVTSGSATVAGSGTAFLTELEVGDVITFVDDAGVRRTLPVTAIANNTSLTVSHNAVSTATAVAYADITNRTPLTKVSLGRSAVKTGTIAIAAGAAAVVGTGTLFTTETAVGDILMWTDAGGSVRTGVVSLITDNTHLTLTMAVPNAATASTYQVLNATSIPGTYPKYSDVSVGFFDNSDGQTDLGDLQPIGIQQTGFGGMGMLRRPRYFPPGGLLVLRFQNNVNAIREVSGFVYGNQLVT